MCSVDGEIAVEKGWNEDRQLEVGTVLGVILGSDGVSDKRASVTPGGVEFDHGVVDFVLVVVVGAVRDNSFVHVDGDTVYDIGDLDDSLGHHVTFSLSEHEMHTFVFNDQSCWNLESPAWRSLSVTTSTASPIVNHFIRRLLLSLAS